MKWICTTEVDITHVRSFNLVAFPRKETFHIGRSGAELSSSVDKFIKISILENTFDDPKGSVSLEVGYTWLIYCNITTIDWLTLDIRRMCASDQQRFVLLK